MDFEERLDFGNNDVSHSAGGSLADFGKHLEGLGDLIIMTDEGRQLWRTEQRNSLSRFPLECTDEVSPQVQRMLMRRRGIWMLSYLLPPGDGRAANCHDYICKDRDYSIDRLDSKIRRDIRRGGRSFEIRLCSWEEFREHGLVAWAETNERLGFAPPTPEMVSTMADRNKPSPCYEVWGAWDGDSLEAWYQIVKVDNWTMIYIARSRTESMRNCPNNALAYAIVRRSLIAEGRDYVTYGLSSSEISDASSMHRFKSKMGFTPVPYHRMFQPHPLLRVALANPLARTASRLLTRAFPTSRVLRKVAGVANLLGNAPDIGD